MHTTTGTRRSIGVAATAALLALALAAPAAATPRGRADTRFGERGVARLDLGRHEEPFGTWARPDGSFLVGFEQRLPGTWETTLHLASFHADGRLDRDFARNGALAIGSGWGWFARHQIAVDSRGRVVVAHSPDVTQSRLRRWNRDGTPDRSFGRNGTVALRAGSHALGVVTVAEDAVVVLVRDGSGVGLGWYGGAAAFVWTAQRFHADGTPDAAFGTAGTAPVTGATYPGAGVLDAQLRVTRSGHVFVAGTSYGPDLTARVLVTRLLPSGAIDLDFGVAGQAIPDLRGSQLQDLEVLGEQPVLLVNTYGDSVAVPGRWGYAVVRLTIRGEPDQRFAENGTYRRLMAPGGPLPSEIAIDPSQRTYLGMYRPRYGENAQGLCGPEACPTSAVVALTDRGLLDVGFGVDGTVETPGVMANLAVTRRGLLVSGALARDTWDIGVVRATR